ncbi:hypothetical protein [Amycolatopsis sp. cmx-11-32]|uniref:hypothetical protein n=1 Tax=Amycolatopsis sp. cmx-11-32 TaxID=2785796 RepID=UPI0039E23ACE
MTTALAFNPRAARFLDAAFDEEVLLRRVQGRQVRALAEFAGVGGSRHRTKDSVR